MKTISAVPTNRQLQFYACYGLLLVLSLLICRSTPAKTTSGASTPNNQPQLGHDSWGFKEGAPDEIISLAQTTDGFLWIASPSGLFRFNGERFERYRPPSGAELISTNITALFAPPSGGLWIGYRFGGFGFLQHGRLTNYTHDASSTGSLRVFVQDRDGIIWAAADTGLWRFDHSKWQRTGAEWNVPKNPLYMGLDRADYIWILSGELSLFYLAPGAKRFEMAEPDVAAAGYPDPTGFTYDADGFVVTSKSWRPRGAPETGGPPAYPLLKEHSFVVIDRRGGLWIVYFNQAGLARLWPARPAEDSLAAARLTPRRSNDDVNASTIVPGDSSGVDYYPLRIYAQARLVDQEGNIWFGGPRVFTAFSTSPSCNPLLSSCPGQSVSPAMVRVAYGPEDEAHLYSIFTQDSKKYPAPNHGS